MPKLRESPFDIGLSGKLSALAKRRHRVHGRFADEGGRSLIGAYDSDQLKFGKHAGGSNDARWATHLPTGARWLVKGYRGDRNRVATELLSNAIYRDMGAKVPVAGIIEHQRDPDFREIKDTVPEPPLPKGQPGKYLRISTGMVARAPDGRVVVFDPKGGFGGYKTTLPKGGLEHGYTPQQNAHKELFEETGLHAHITGFLGDYPGDTGVTRVYTAELTGGSMLPPDDTPYEVGGRESSAVRLLDPSDAFGAFNRTRDKRILSDALATPFHPQGFPDTFPPARLGESLAYPALEGKPVDFAFEKGPSHRVGEHFMTDALLANWDVAGLMDDNILWSPEGEPFRVDQGGTLEYRAQGQPKPYGPVPLEVASMMEKHAQGRRSSRVSLAEMRQQAGEIAKRLDPARIDELVDSAGFTDGAMRERVRSNLKARVAWMGRFAQGKEQIPNVAKTQKQSRLAQIHKLFESVFPAALQEALVSAFHWDELEHPRDLHGQFRKKIGLLNTNQGFHLDKKTRISRDKDGLFRVTRSGLPAKGFLASSDVARYALDVSAKSKDADSVGGVSHSRITMTTSRPAE